MAWLLLVFVVCQWCSVVGKDTCVVQRSLLKDGFHRELQTTVNVSGVSLPADVLLSEVLPSGLYVDPFQVETLYNEGGAPYVHVREHVDIESPQHLSGALHVDVYGKLDHGTVDSSHLTMTIPVHVRYHKPGHQRAEVTVAPPTVYIRHKSDDVVSGVISMPCPPPHTHQLCLWHTLHCSYPDRLLHIEVPVGDVEHTLWVVCGTLTVTLAGMIIIGRTILLSYKHKIS